MSKEHHLKTENPWFSEVWEYQKTFERRIWDRDYEVGDTLFLYEYDKHKEEFSGRRAEVKISSILKTLDENRLVHAIMSFRRLDDKAIIPWAQSTWQANQPGVINAN